MCSVVKQWEGLFLRAIKMELPIKPQSPNQLFQTMSSIQIDWITMTFDSSFLDVCNVSQVF